ncbi:hypothetical protein ECMP0210179_3572 [Escherichia coli MP021017.9]|nr:hypothetical protein ECMP0210179_3572 [Escherichia coli MP021017.9]ENA12200.1 hypothetical protein ECP02989421_3706 [Escherichia coli P0298942.1]
MYKSAVNQGSYIEKMKMLYCNSPPVGAPHSRSNNPLCQMPNRT